MQQEFAGDSAVLCYSCIEKAKKLDKFQGQLIRLKQDMADALGCSHNDVDSVTEHNHNSALPGASQTPQRVNRRTSERSKSATEPAKKAKSIDKRYCFWNARSILL